LYNKLKNNSFSSQVDESTDFTNKCHVIAFVIYVNDGEIQEKYFCCKELPETSKGQDIFNVLSSYMESRGLSWRNYVGICTDCAPSMLGSMRGFTYLVKKESPDVVTTHCLLHKKMLVSKALGDGMKNVVGGATKWLTLLNKDQFARECLKNCVKT
jgi:hypothetical protein